MKRGLLISLLLHVFVFFFVFVSVPENFFPKEQVQTISIKLVAAKNVAKTTKKETPKAQNTQQSAAPKAPPKKKEKPKPKKKVDPKKPKVVNELPKKNKQAKKKVEVAKKEPKKQPEPKKVEKQAEHRPAKLDKTQDKKNVIKDNAKPKTESTDDFLKALSFIEDLKSEQSAMFEGEETEKTTINVAEQAELAIIKKHIERNWYKTPGTKFNNALLLRLKLNRDGTLASLEVIESSGSPSLDRSLIRAARKAAPLPIPTDKYDLFKEIDLYWNG